MLSPSIRLLLLLFSKKIIIVIIIIMRYDSNTMTGGLVDIGWMGGRIYRKLLRCFLIRIPHCIVVLCFNHCIRQKLLLSWWAEHDEMVSRTSTLLVFNTKYLDIDWDKSWLAGRISRNCCEGSLHLLNNCIKGSVLTVFDLN